MAILKNLWLDKGIVCIQGALPNLVRKHHCIIVKSELGRWFANSKVIGNPGKVRSGLYVEENEAVSLKDNKLDRCVALAKGVLGAAPVVGPIMAEVVEAIIPNQRMDRIVKFVEILDNKLDGFSQDIMRLKVQDEYFVDLLEDSMILASRAITDERKDHIATIIKNSLTKDELSHLEEKRLLNILSELSDAEIVILQFYALIGQEQRAYMEKHRDILETPIVHMSSSVEEIERSAIYKTFKQNLVAQNLLNPRYVKPKKNELPEFDDKTGMIKANGYNVTPLGRLLLKYLDLKTGF